MLFRWGAEGCMSGMETSKTSDAWVNDATLEPAASTNFVIPSCIARAACLSKIEKAADVLFYKGKLLVSLQRAASQQAVLLQNQTS